MAGLFGGGGAAPAPAPQPVLPPAPGTLQQTIISGNPNPPATPPPVGETEDERKRRLDMQSNILGGGMGGDGASDGGSGAGAADGSGSAAP